MSDRKINKKFFWRAENYQVQEDEVGGACDANGGEEKRVQVIGRESRGKEITRKIKS
jgi:hypothetical protein